MTTTTTKATISDGIGWRHSNSLITTKTALTTTNQVVPGFSRPNQNGALLNVPIGTQRDAAAKEFNGPARKARPMKHWRRKLQPTPNSGRSVNSVSLVIDTPGGTAKPGNGGSCNCADSTANSYAKFDEKLLKIPSQKCDPCVLVENKGYVQVGNPSDPNSYQIQTGLYNTKYVGVCPENNVIKSAVTLMSKAYYSDTRAYLQSRCKRYEQKLSTNPVPGVAYIGANHMPLWPSNDCIGPQTRLTRVQPKRGSVANQVPGHHHIQAQQCAVCETGRSQQQHAHAQPAREHGEFKRQLVLQRLWGAGCKCRQIQHRIQPGVFCQKQFSAPELQP
jgi:hypothetical protein